MKKEKRSVKYSAIVLLKVQEMVYNAFESIIFLLPFQLGIEKSEQSEQSNNYHKYISLEANSTSPNKRLSNFDGSLLTPAGTGRGVKILTSKEMLQRLPKALAQVKAGDTSDNLKKFLII